MGRCRHAIVGLKPFIIIETGNTDGFSVASRQRRDPLGTRHWRFHNRHDLDAPPGFFSCLFVSEFAEHGFGAAFFHAFFIHTQVFHHAVIGDQGEAFAADAHAATGGIQFQAQGFGKLRVAVR